MNFSRLAAFLFVLAAICAMQVGSLANGEMQNSTTKTRLKIKKKTKMNDSINGVWSGEHITMQITENGATVEYDCAHGSVDQKIFLDKEKRFSATGTHVPERGGPIRLNQQRAGFAVKYAGQINGKEMKLTVTRDENDEVIGTFTLFQGRQARLVKCR